MFLSVARRGCKQDSKIQLGSMEAVTGAARARRSFEAECTLTVFWAFGGREPVPVQIQLRPVSSRAISKGVR